MTSASPLIWKFSCIMHVFAVRWAYLAQPLFTVASLPGTVSGTIKEVV